ncbi:hypothetical protein T069G_02331 [Trichoderma breve]|uniref:Uncharacterized protein n=1 Tax=Trichoderma breve TaxID=2034170 RepID=A0A9W9BF89_9HYPO|nr:hypothetical protein T069G_02331 [Trichoderma breve]KAJ4861377.1 hypothetical protein T069G_02331 [Trichoderma breve]
MSSSRPFGKVVEKESLADTAERVCLLLVCCQEIADEKIQSFAAVQLLSFNEWVDDYRVFAAQHASLDYQLRTTPSFISIIENYLDTIIECLLATLKGSTEVSDDQIDTFLAVPISHVPIIARNLLLDSAFDGCTRTKQLQTVEARITSLSNLSSQIRQRVHRQSLVEIPELLDFDKEYVITRERIGDGLDSEFHVDGTHFDVGKEFEKFVREALTHKWFHFHSNNEKNLSEEQMSYRQWLLERCVTIISTRRRQLACFRAHYSHEETFALKQVVTRFKFKPPLSNLVPSSSTSIIADDGFGFRFGGPFDVPQPPNLAESEEETSCPYCYLALPAETFSAQNSAERWERHLLEDLQPYICLFENCDTPGKTYSSFRMCRDAIDDDVVTFYTCEKFAMHFEMEHPDHDLSSVEDPFLYRSQLDALSQWCFVCCEALPQRDMLLEHIANHLRSMSLLALPWRDDITDKEDVASEKATGSVTSDGIDNDGPGKQLDGVGLWGWEETKERIDSPERKLDKHEFASLLLAANETPQDRLQVLELWIQDTRLSGTIQRRARRNWRLSLNVVRVITELRKNTIWWQAQRRENRIQEDMIWPRNYTVGWICALPVKFAVSEVGIGGGVPSTAKDIRLGDVFVGDPATDAGGVVEYDSDEISRGGKFVYRRFPNSLPRDLRNAMGTLKADRQLGHKLSEHLQGMLKNCKKMQAQYSRPSPETDVLFRFYEDHLGAEGDCSACPKDLLQSRRARDSVPIVHYGLIASGDEVMKHGETRDGLSREYGIECFEKGAVDLIFGFQCLVIRGISDYADSHRNDIWQPYAAAMAAEYAKELLHFLPPDTSTSLSTDVCYRLTKHQSHTDSIEIEEDPTSADGNMRITLAPNDANQPGKYWKLQPCDTERAWVISTLASPDMILGVGPGDSTRPCLSPAASVPGQRWNIIQRDGGAVSLQVKCLGHRGYLCASGYPAEITLCEEDENDASQLWRLHATVLAR